MVVNDIPLKGFTDKIQFWKNDIIITDFKTGSLQQSQKKGEFELPGSDKKPEGGNYWRQAVFYKILVDNLPGKNWNVLHTQFDFVEPNSKDEFDIQKLSITAEEVEKVKEQIVKYGTKFNNMTFIRVVVNPNVNGAILQKTIRSIHR